MTIMKKLRWGIASGYRSQLSRYSAPPTEKHWKRCLEKYLQTNPSEEEYKLFLKYNKEAWDKV